ncbi:MAG: DUF3048 domain-containing protein [Candidatus Blackburnbacteria bacterium]|nr:DUF3048 domain-containing protein [Candidatus Blackburnbacteria bacterium]
MNISNLLASQKTKIVLGIVGLYFLSAGVSYFAFSYLKKGPAEFISPAALEQKRSGIDVSGPKTEECPLNGKKYTKAEKDIWQTRRPLGVMIENHQESRPQSGLSKADVVYEAIAEGGITRFMTLFYCGVSAEEVQVGPVRSARTYYLDWISEYGTSPLYVHVGGANKPGPADALGQIRKYGWDVYNDMNQFSIGFPTFWRDYERLGRPVATEHTMYSTTDKLWEVAKERGLTSEDKNGKKWDDSFISWKFTDGKSATSPSAARISFSFWEGYKDYAVSWVYDPATNFYKRENGDAAHLDFNNQEQLSASNIVVMFTGVKGPIDELKHMLYTTTGGGKALVFQNGDVVETTWSKKSRTERTRFLDKKGAEINFARGPIWIEVLATGTDVEY